VTFDMWHLRKTLTYLLTCVLQAGLVASCKEDGAVGGTDWGEDRVSIADCCVQLDDRVRWLLRQCSGLGWDTSMPTV